MSEEKLWRKVNPGGKTRDEFEKGELTQNGKPVTADELYSLFEQVRKVKTAELKGREQAKESPKNLEEIEFIGMVQMMISKERERLGLAPGFYIELERTRLFHPEEWERRESHNPRNRGEYRTHQGLAETQTTDPSPFRSPYAYFRTISHELLHQASHHEADPLGGAMAYRIGYLTFKDGYGHGINEALTEETNDEILREHGDTLSSHFPQTLNDRPFKWWIEDSSYTGYRKTVKELASKVDKILYNDVPTTWDNLKRGYFAGEQKAFADIEKALGRDSLELLLLLGNPELFNTDENTIEKSYWHIEHTIQQYLTERLSPAQKEGIYRNTIKLKKNKETPMEPIISGK